jgi:hypothetical protein
MGYGSFLVGVCAGRPTMVAVRGVGVRCQWAWAALRVVSCLLLLVWDVLLRCC